jgi:hypothetical protein
VIGETGSATDESSRYKDGHSAALPTCFSSAGPSDSDDLDKKLDGMGLVHGVQSTGLCEESTFAQQLSTESKNVATTGTTDAVIYEASIDSQPRSHVDIDRPH